MKVKSEYTFCLARTLQHQITVKAHSDDAAQRKLKRKLKKVDKEIERLMKDIGIFLEPSEMWDWY